MQRPSSAHARIHSQRTVRPLLISLHVESNILAAPLAPWRLDVEARLHSLMLRRLSDGARRPTPLGSVHSGRHGVREAALPLDRPGDHVRPHLRRRGVRGESGDLLRRHGARRRVEDDEQRRDCSRRCFRTAGCCRSATSPSRRSNPDLVWVGTGEVEQPPEHVLGRRRLQVDRRRQDVPEHGPRATRKHIDRIVIDPTNNDVVLVAAHGPLFGPGGDRGVYKTTDGGTTWKQRARRSTTTRARTTS